MNRAFTVITPTARRVRTRGLQLIIAIAMLIACSARADEWYSETLSNTPVQVTTGPTKVFGVLIHNDNATPVFVHRYDALSGAVTVGTTAQTRAAWPIAANGFLWLARNGSVHDQFTVGMTIAATMGTTADKYTATAAPTTPLTVQIFYQK